MKFFGLVSAAFGWVAFLLMCLFSVVSFFSPDGVAAGIIFLIIAVAYFPAEPVRTIMKKILPSRNLRDIIIAILFIIGCLLFPSDSETEQGPTETAEMYDELN